MSNPTQQQTPSTIPAGWYPNPSGEQQWWDGYQWGILKPKPNTYGTIAIITGAISLVVCLIPFGVFLGGIGALVAIVFGIIGIMRARKGSSIAGITFGVIALILGIIITSAAFAGIGQAGTTTYHPIPVAPEASATAGPAGPVLTVAQQQAAIAAQGYLRIGGFSYQGLIDQLSSSAGNGFAVADATAAVNSLSVDYNAQAVIAAKEYMKIGGFSHASLVEQLSSSAGNKFTPEQAEYAATQVGL